MEKTNKQTKYNDQNYLETICTRTRSEYVGKYQNIH